MYKDLILFFLLVITFALFYLLISGSMCNCKCVPYKPYTTTYRAYLA